MIIVLLVSPLDPGIVPTTTPEGNRYRKQGKGREG